MLVKFNEVSLSKLREKYEQQNEREVGITQEKLRKNKRETIIVTLSAFIIGSLLFAIGYILGVIFPGNDLAFLGSAITYVVGTFSVVLAFACILSYSEIKENVKQTYFCDAEKLYNYYTVSLQRIKNCDEVLGLNFQVSFLLFIISVNGHIEQVCIPIDKIIVKSNTDGIINSDFIDGKITAQVPCDAFFGTYKVDDNGVLTSGEINNITIEFTSSSAKNWILD